MNTNDKILEVLSDKSFFDSNADLADPNEIILAIQERVPEASTDEIDAVLTMISEAANRDSNELQEDDLEEVAGGFAITLTVTTVLTIIGASASAGAAVGAAIWYWKNRKR